MSTRSEQEAPSTPGALSMHHDLTSKISRTQGSLLFCFAVMETLWEWDIHRAHKGLSLGRTEAHYTAALRSHLCTCCSIGCTA